MDLFNEYLHQYTSHSVDPREQEKDMQRTWGVDRVPFLPFMSSSSVVLQLSVDPCDERETMCKMEGWLYDGGKTGIEQV